MEVGGTNKWRNISACVCVSEVCVHVKMQIRSAVNRPALPLPGFIYTSNLCSRRLQKPEWLLFTIWLSSISGACSLCGHNLSETNHRRACICSRLPTTLLLLYPTCCIDPTQSAQKYVSTPAFRAVPNRSCMNLTSLFGI